MRKLIRWSWQKFSHIIFIFLLLSAWCAGKQHEKWIICGDIDFYYGGGKDGDLVKIRDCKQTNYGVTKNDSITNGK